MKNQVVLCYGLEQANLIIDNELLNLSKKYICLHSHFDFANNILSSDFKKYYIYQDIKTNSILLFEAQYIYASKILIINQNRFDTKLFDILKQIKLLNENVVHVLQPTKGVK